ncbi:transcriptional regulator [Mycobacterium gastri 'Wayne']|nr:transcriptional regulator [Mycobacterium gastri 'Wayne']
MVLGRFLPPHAGHIYLCEFAHRWVDDLTIVISVQAQDPISSTQRVAWMRELFPFDRVTRLSIENLQHPSDQPPSWARWKAGLEEVLPVRPDFVFASEPYGADFARILGARFVSVDQPRAVVPVSATCIRANPFAHWQHIPRCVRPAFVKRVSILSPDPAEASALAMALAEKLGTKWVPEWSRTPRDLNEGSSTALDWTEIVRGQIASEEALARDADRVLICATDPLATTMWAELLLGSCPTGLRELPRRPYDLTLLMTPNTPSDTAGVAYPLSEGVNFVARCERALRAVGRPFVVVNGGWEERTATALRAVEKLTPSHCAREVR